MLTHVLARLGRCAAVEACKLSSGSGSGSGSFAMKPLDCAPGLAQHLLDSFPSLTALFLHGYSVTCSGLASLLSHPQLSLQLQQLDLQSVILQPQQPGPGAISLANLFHGARLKELRLDVSKTAPLPDLQPLAQHLTQLHIRVPETTSDECDDDSQNGEIYAHGGWSDGEEGFGEVDGFSAAVGPLPLLQELHVSGDILKRGYEPLFQLLQGLPRLHTLHLDGLLYGQELDALLAATQLTSVSVSLVGGLNSSHAEAPCSWQRLEMTQVHDCTTISDLPLHSLTQPLVLYGLGFDLFDLLDTKASVAAAVYNLTQACKVAVRIQRLELHRLGSHFMAQGMLALLQPLSKCCCDTVSLCCQDAAFSVEDITLIAPLCQHCTHLMFYHGSMAACTEFWCQLVQLMPNVATVTVLNTEGFDSVAMCDSLLCMAGQPWARRLDIRVDAIHQPPPCWDIFAPPNQTSKVSVTWPAYMLPAT
ncbi:hypothetical protein QJQ45_000570 [Haematococcus lacustris]|nr:hypothetical protein QJQ45_000570 [Haematococcus lacustris]